MNIADNPSVKVVEPDVASHYIASLIADSPSVKVVELAVKICNTTLWEEKISAIPPFSGKESERSDSEKIRHDQIRRDYFPEYDRDIAIWGILMAVDSINDQRCKADQDLLPIRAAITAAEKAAGIERECLRHRIRTLDGLPAEVKALYAANRRRETTLKAAVLREYGENDLAELLLNDPDAYDAKFELGFVKVFGPNPSRKVHDAPASDKP